MQVPLPFVLLKKIPGPTDDLYVARLHRHDLHAREINAGAGKAVTERKAKHLEYALDALPKEKREQSRQTLETQDQCVTLASPAHLFVL
jgi:hypothetical protein